MHKAKAIGKKSCPNCGPQGDGKGDNLVLYDDGSSWCFACNYNTPKSEFLLGVYEDIEERCLDKLTCERYKVIVSGNKIVYQFFEQGMLKAQKYRNREEKSDQRWIKNSSNLFGQCSFPTTEHSSKVPLVITTGEYDAMSVYQATGLPAVSVTHGDGGASRDLAKVINYVQSFKHVVLMFDNDESGQRAIEECADLFEPGTVRVARLPLKDANEMLKANRGEELKRIIWAAELVLPDAIISLKDLLPEILTKPTYGISWGNKELDEWTEGISPGEIYIVAAPKGIGKTEFLRSTMNCAMSQGHKVGLFSLEQSGRETGQRLVGASLGRRIHLASVAKDWWDIDKITREVEKYADSLYIFKNDRSLPADLMLLYMNYMVKFYGVRLLVLDNLNALCSSAYIEGKYVGEMTYIPYIVTKLHEFLKKINNKYEVSLIIASHLNKDQIHKSTHINIDKDDYMRISADDVNKKLSAPGLKWQSGRMPTLENVYGHGTVTNLANYVLGLSRNTEAEDDLERRTTYVKLLAARKDSRFTGHILKRVYDYDTGDYVEVIGGV